MTVGLARTLAVPNSGMTDDAGIKSTVPNSPVFTLVAKRDWFFRPRKFNVLFFILSDDSVCLCRFVLQNRSSVHFEAGA